jgi:hypothetical protein
MSSQSVNGYRKPNDEICERGIPEGSAQRLTASSKTKLAAAHYPVFVNR